MAADDIPDITPLNSRYDDRDESIDVDDTRYMYGQDGSLYEIASDGQRKKDPLNFNSWVFDGCQYDAKLGRGASSKIEHTTCRFATKITPFVEVEHQRQAQNEIRILRRLSHPNIVTLLASKFDQGMIFQIIPLARQGSLEVMNRRQSLVVLERLEDAFKQVLEGIRSQLVVHRDIKPANVLVYDEGHVKIGDFGISKLLRTPSEQCHTFVGTALYMSHSRLKGDPYSFEADMWSFGVMVLQAVLCKTYEQSPFGACVRVKSYFDLLQQITDFEFPSAVDSIVGNRLLDLVQDVMEFQVPDRRSPDTIMAS